MLAGTANPIQKPTVTRSNKLTTTDPMSAVAGFRCLPPTPAQSASYHTIPRDDSTPEFSWVPDLSSLHPGPPTHTADRWSTASSLVFPSMDLLAMPAWNEEREVKACNTTSLSQYDITPQIAYHVPFYFSTSIPVQPHYPEAIINGDVAETWDMNTARRTIAGQIDEQSLHTIEDNNSRDKENDEQYVVWNRSGFSLIRRGGSLLVATNTPTPNQHAQGNHQPASLTHEASVASILTSVYQSRPPTGAGVYPTPASDIDTDWMPSHQDAPTGPIRQQASSRGRRQALQRVYDKPGNKPAVAYEPDLLRLQELSRRRGGQDFAIAWILKAFTQGVTVDALRRTLSEDEITAVDHDHGFPLSQVYDRFLEKVEDRFECGLCAEEKRANWKNKKDAVRHFQKFHFGTGQTCGTCKKTYYSRAEWNRHVCSRMVMVGDVA